MQIVLLIFFFFFYDIVYNKNEIRFIVDNLLNLLNSLFYTLDVILYVNLLLEAKKILNFLISFPSVILINSIAKLN